MMGDVTRLIQQPDGTWREDAPTECPKCRLAWPWDGTKGRVLQGSGAGGKRLYECLGCGYQSGPGVPVGIGAAPNGKVMRR